MTDLTSLSIQQAQEGLKKKQFSAVELTQAFLKRIASIDQQLQSFVTVSPELAIQHAEACDTAIQCGQIKALTGIPMAPKDIYLTQGLRTTCSSKILENFVPEYNATVIQKCLDEGMIILGKTNLDEFAMGSSTENSALKQTKNPWDITRTPGGSSGGSAAAVAADLCIASLGTDTGGSIRQPASFCSIVGLKPTYGRVSRFGTIAFASSLDQMGPMTKTVADSAILMNIIAGQDVKDSTSLHVAVPDYTQVLGQSLKGIKIGVPHEFFQEGVSIEVKQAVQKALQTYKELGCELIDINLPNTRYAVATYYIIAPAEASSNLARYDGVRFGLREAGNSLLEMYKNTRGAGFGKEVKRRIMIGTYVLSAGYYDAYYIKAQKARTVIRDDYHAAFKTVDVIMGPVTPTTAFKIGEKSGDPLQMYLNDILTISTNLAGLPGMSLPCGFDPQGLPIGLQLIGRAFDESTLLKVAHAYEQATFWHKTKPNLSNIQQAN